MARNRGRPQLIPSSVPDSSVTCAVGRASEWVVTCATHWLETMRLEEKIMRKELRLLGLALLVVGAVGLAACEPTEPAEEEEPTEGADGGVPEGAVVSVKADALPTLDGVADDEVWANAEETVIEVEGGENESATEVTIKSIYTDDTVSFLVTWGDPTQSYLRSPWEKQPDGTWMQLSDPNDRGGDNNLWYEDKLSFIWSIGNSIADFDDDGCDTACHAGEDSDIKPYGNKYTEDEGEMGDIWHLKSVRNVGQVDDQYLDDTRLDPDNLEETREAGRHSDPNDGGGYKDNKTEDGTLPAFMLPPSGAKDGAPGFILDTEKVPFDDSQFAPGDRIPGVVVAPFLGDRADISGAWIWEDGTWTLEFSRALTTGSEFDVQFDDLDATYYFGVATFDNAQVRHATQDGVTPFMFQAE